MSITVKAAADTQLCSPARSQQPPRSITVTVRWNRLSPAQAQFTDEGIDEEVQKQQSCSSGVTSPVAKGRRTSGFAEKENAFDARSGCVRARSCSAERRPSSTLKRRWRTKSQCSLAPSARPKSTALYRRTESAAFAPYLAASHVAGTGPRTHSMRAGLLAEDRAHHIPERSRRRRQFRFSSKWRGRKDVEGFLSPRPRRWPGKAGLL